MYFTKDFFTGISFVCVGVAGMAFVLSRRKTAPSTDECEPEDIIEDLEDDDTDDLPYFDAETGSCLSTENVQITTPPKSLEELYDDEAEKRAFRDLKHEFELCKMTCLSMKNQMSDAVQKLRFTVDKQELTLGCLKSDMSDVKTDLNRLIQSVDSLRTEIKTSTERNTEKPDSCKVGRLKTRISVLEREVTKNSSQIIGMEHTIRTLMLTRLDSGVGAAPVTSAAGDNRFDRNPPNAHCLQPTAPMSSSTLTTTVPSTIPRPPPPPPAENFSCGPPPPPPPPMMETSGTPSFRSELVKKSGPPEVAGQNANAPKIYGRIPITVDILKSVVLKPVTRRT